MRPSPYARNVWPWATSGAVNESSPRGPGADDSCAVHPARTRRVPLPGDRGPSAAVTPGGPGWGESAKGWGLFFPPPPAVWGNFRGGGVSVCPDFPRLDSGS